MKYQILALSVTGYRWWLWHHSFGGYYPDQGVYTKFGPSKKKILTKEKSLVEKNYKPLTALSPLPTRLCTYLLPTFRNFWGYLSMRFSWVCTLWSSLSTLITITSQKAYLLRLVFGDQKLTVSYYLKTFRGQLKLL